MAIVENFSEPDIIKPLYAEYFEKLKTLPHKFVSGIIEVHAVPTNYPEGMNGAPDWLIDKAVKTREKDRTAVAATLLYWASLHTFYTSQEHDVDLARYLDIVESDDCRALGACLAESMSPKPYRAEIEASVERKERMFWTRRARGFMPATGATRFIF